MLRLGGVLAAECSESVDLKEIIIRAKIDYC